MEFERLVYPKLKSAPKGKVTILYGPRRTGKTFLLKKLEGELSESGEKVAFVLGESRITQDNMATLIPEQIAGFFGGATTVIVDEAQKIPQAGLALKMAVDALPETRIIASGSSSFDLANQTGEPLTGRKQTITLPPISAREIIQTRTVPKYLANLESYLIFGSYPETLLAKTRKAKETYLGELVDAYLFKDILELEKIKNAKKIRDLLTLIAFQIGKEVSLSDLGNKLDIHKNTVARYLDLLEKSFVVINIRGLSRNLRGEVYKTSRYYFWDNGIRNGIINNFNRLGLRNDVGMLWENYLVAERIKKQKIEGIRVNNYFWRTYAKQEVDWVEERGGKLRGFEIKWRKGRGKRSNAPSEWRQNYPQASFEEINRDNFLKFIG